MEIEPTSSKRGTPPVCAEVQASHERPIDQYADTKALIKHKAIVPMNNSPIRPTNSWE